MNIAIVIVLAMTLPLLNSCGGGGTQVAEGGIGGTGVSMGRVSGFGSLYVNGVKYDTSDTTYIYEDAEPVYDDAGIAVGMVVKVTGTQDGLTGVADTVAYAKLLEGTLSANNIASNETGTLSAMGQTITVDADTVYDDGDSGTPLSALPLGAIIEVSGFTDGSGNILATRIETHALSYANQELELKGVVDQLNSDALSFMLGSLQIDYSGAALPDAEITDGLYVEVKGTLQNDLLLATSVELEDGGDLAIAEDGEEAELEGIVTEILTAGTDSTLFFLNGQQVLVDTSTEYEPQGTDASNIVLDQPLEAAGIMEGTLLVAAEIEMKTTSAEKEELQALVESVDPTDNSLTLLGQRVRTTTSTIYEDDTDAVSLTNYDSLSAGDYVSVDLYVAADGVFEASKLEHEVIPEKANWAEIEGVVDEVIDEQTLKVVGVRVDISDPELSGFAPLTGERVEIAGTYADGLLTARSASLESDSESD